MKILITGGYGFIGSFIGEKFFREKHEIYIIDNLSTGKKENVYFRHKALLSTIESDECEEFFKAHKFDVVIHCAAQTDVQLSILSPKKDSEVNVVGLSNILNLSAKYGVKQFVFASSAAVYGDNLSIPLTEETACNPISPYGINKQIGEMYCKKWNELYNLSTLIFRFSNVYGPRQNFSKESGVISVFVNKVLHGDTITIHGNGEQTRDFVYVGDVADAIYRSVISQLTGIYNLSSETETSINQLINLLSEHEEISDIQHSEQRHGDIEKSSLSNKKIIKHLDWVPKFTLSEGLEKTISYYRNEKDMSTSTESTVLQKNELIRKKSSHLLPYVENLVLFGMFLFTFMFVSPLLDTVDLWLIYILLTSLLFGKTQGVVASVLSIGVQIFDQIGNGRDFASLFVDDSIIATFTIYLVIGFVVGYVVDKRKIALHFAEDELDSSLQKYKFINDIYQDTRLVKENLQSQILHTEDSVGKVYSVVKKLENLEPEEVFHGAIAVLQDLLKSEKFGIYVTSPESSYLRLIAKSNVKDFEIESSIQSNETLYGKAIETQKVQFNWMFSENSPMIFAPITQNDQVIALVVGYDLPFEKLNLHYQNLVEVTTRLISSSLSRAYSYVTEINNGRFLRDTKVLTPMYFNRIVESKLNSFKELNVPFVLLEIDASVENTERMIEISNLLRTNDYLGINKSNQVFIILSNLGEWDAANVIARFNSKGFNTTVVEGGMVNAS
ncbi:MAG: NAD-dependent epimerase/dehydratase family protein [Bacillus sp. (in: Bacteria)]|nr:NAD-dependent epimerase/dehydratase family protein [Bacillus sp. (in: firmicutes)]